MKKLDKPVPHRGFDSKVAKTSLNLTLRYNNAVSAAEKSLKIITSTPLSKSNCKSIMDVSFSKCFENSSKGSELCGIVADNDSGYISNNQESNSVFAMESCSSLNAKPIYLSEDALLEKPEVAKKKEVLESAEHAEEPSNLPSLSDSVVLSSFPSEKTSYSGLEASSVSSDSFSISAQSPIVAENSSCDTGMSTDFSVENTCSFTESQDNNGDSININYRSQTNHASECSSDVSISGKLNVTELCIKTPNKIYKNPVTSDVSPDLFSDEEPEQVVEVNVNKQLSKTVADERYVHRKDRRLINRVNAALSGVLPPPSFTVIHMTAEQILSKLENNKHLFWTANDVLQKENEKCSVAECSSVLERRMIDETSLLVTGDKGSCIDQDWPQILEKRYHGLHHNRSKLSEEFELLCTKYAQRYVNAETQSTCTVFEVTLASPSKRKSTKLRWNSKSPGRRLSHLARRRITFSNSMLQSSSSAICSRAKQILVDARRLELLSRRKSPSKKSPRKTPRKSPRKTPRKSPRIKGRTPTSSSKKRLALQFKMFTDNEDAVPSTSSSSSSFRASGSKRALFQSPDHDSSLRLLAPSTSGLSFSSNIPKRNTPKRALFTSPEKNSPSKIGSIFDKKRKRSDSDESQPTKFSRSLSLDIRPSGSEVEKPTALLRRQSECSAIQWRSSELSAHHKKKLQWAVYEALKSRNIGINHPQFKTFASVLARVTRRFLPNLSANVPRPEGGTSERMLKIARQYVFAVTKGKTVDEIVQEAENSKLRQKKPVGYVSVEDACKMDVSQARNKENILQDNTNILNSIEKKPKAEVLKPRFASSENRVDRIRKVIDFGDDMR